MAQQASGPIAAEEDEFADADDEFASCYSGFSRMNSFTHEGSSFGAISKQAPSNPDQVKVKLEQGAAAQGQQHALSSAVEKDSSPKQQASQQQQQPHQQQQQQQGASHSQGGTGRAPPPKPKRDKNQGKCCTIQ
ncbi:hypothetical protein DUNSADRAFT_13903 [Dunaliella salina]|uniref:Uncharacterized protein n=1 Tax=Dunaliella salina TaxID=3046 RepID=A0ABQ7G8G0_DUNSA|nr:hypothetical protein DUNSADRAFT_13903 [Dunaliella salina]|eukprot:KAF5830893.1 hypothetical protein DUNSADRAFT_13903 [Dunaliella salina]